MLIGAPHRGEHDDPRTAAHTSVGTAEPTA